MKKLIDAIWDGNNYVGEKALTNVIWQLRSSFEKLGLCDCIQTVRKRGYRLAAEANLPCQCISSHTHL